MVVVEAEKNSWGGFEDGGDGMGLWELSIFDTFRFQRLLFFFCRYSIRLPVVVPSGRGY